MFDVVRGITRGLLPPRCVFCDRLLANGRICAGCYRDLPWQRRACPRCAEPLVVSVPIACGSCQRQAPPWHRAAAPLCYTYPVDTALKALKFRACLRYAPAFADLMLPLLEERFADVDVLLPVPLNRWRQAQRGFNQATEICRPLARASGLALAGGVRRVRATRAQAGLDRRARRRNLDGAFAVVSPLGARHPLLVDDVMTTGETCRQLAAVLLASGAKRVSVLTVARAAASDYAAGAVNV